MATVSQIQRGFALFVDNEVASAFTGWQKAVVGGFGGLIAANFPTLVKTYGSHPFVASLGLYNAENNTVNIDALYSAVVPRLAAEKIPITIPKIGTIKIGREEIDTLVKYIREA